MPVDKTSRYARTGRLRFEQLDRDPVELLELRLVPRLEAVFSIVPDASERLDLVAHRYYRDPREFWRICDSSTEMDPFDILVPGRRLRIPPSK